ncbi:hypothetical protein SADUNF_Sadunf05G0055200 [Salix dunnii]|uniref:Uncharacterized protein n=1 Tax=Salix dunnii TaxID=1413687 RepID=A0A835MWY3_9ROSI|nr:hypothetical protein SADUNF_Sadunf05G0055200 [Salix dunnii]
MNNSDFTVNKKFGEKRANFDSKRSQKLKTASVGQAGSGCKFSKDREFGLPIEMAWMSVIMVWLVNQFMRLANHCQDTCFRTIADSRALFLPSNSSRPVAQWLSLELKLQAGEALSVNVLLGYKCSRIAGPESVIPNSPEFN